MKRITFAVIALLGMAVFYGCQVNPEFENPVYACDCGSVTFEGQTYNFLMADYLHYPDTNLLSRKYYLTANMQTGAETEPHHLNLSFYVDTVTDQFFTNDDPFLDLKIEEVNYNETLIPIRMYEADLIAIEVIPAILNGPEYVQFLMQVTEYVNGSPASLPFQMQGYFDVDVIY